MIPLHTPTHRRDVMHDRTSRVECLDHRCYSVCPSHRPHLYAAVKAKHKRVDLP